MDRRFRSSALPAALAAAITSLSGCERSSPTGPPVSDTEIWRLELEQVTDGTSARFQRRGTITIMLRLNHTTQPDPTCAGTGHPDVTTFLADAEALPSRLQPAAGGSANGSWNCHGLTAQVRLGDGTRYTLRSDDIEAVRPVREAVTGADPMAPNRWSAGGRGGHFLLARASAFPWPAGDTHLDLLIENDRSDDIPVGLTRVDGQERWQHHDLSYAFAQDDADLIDGVGERTTVMSIPRAWWPDRFPAPGAGAAGYEFIFSFDDPGRLGGAPAYLPLTCLQGPNPPDQASLGIVPDGAGCGTGWIAQEIALAASPNRLYARRGGPAVRSTISVSGDPTMTVIPSHRALTTTLTSVPRQPGRLVLTVGATADLPIGQQTIEVRAESDTWITSTYLEVYVYDLTVTTSPDTLVLRAGESGATTVRLTEPGVFDPIRLSVAEGGRPPGLGASLDPELVTGDSSQLTLYPRPMTPPGAYDLTICAVIEPDADETCNPGRLTLRVLPAASGDFTMTALPPELRIERGRAATSTIAIGRIGGWKGSVDLSARDLPAGVTATFAPDPSDADSTVLTLAASGTAALGSHTIAIEGTSGATTRTITLGVRVALPSPPGFTLLAEPAAITIPRDGVDSTRIRIVRNGNVGPVRLSGGTSGGIYDVGYYFSPTVVPGDTSYLVFLVGDEASLNTQTVTVVGEANGVLDTTTVQLTVVGGATTAGRAPSSGVAASARSTGPPRPSAASRPFRPGRRGGSVSRRSAGPGRPRRPRSPEAGPRESGSRRGGGGARGCGRPRGPRPRPTS